MNRQSPSAADVDLSAFDSRVDRGASREFFASDEPGAASADAHIMARHRTYRIIMVVALIAIVVGLVLWGLDVETGDDRLVPTMVAGGLLAVITSAITLIRSGAPRAYQIAQFAQANAFSFDRLKDSAGYDGMPFRYGRDHRRWMVVAGAVGGRRVEFGNLTFVEPTTLRNIPRRCGYIAIRLPARLPQMVLNAGHSSTLFGLTLPEPPHRDHELDVGADRAFRLFARPHAEHIARALFVPEVVERFAELAQTYDMEITGDVLFLYSRRDASSADASRWREELAQVEALARWIPFWPVWPVARAQRKDFLRGLPPMRVARFDRSRWSTALIVLSVLLGGTAVLIVLMELPTILT